MSSVLYEGSPLDEYLKESEIEEASECPQELVREVEAPGSFQQSSSELSSTRAWEDVCLRIVECLPVDLILLLGLTPIAPKRTSLTERGRYLLCSSNLLDSSLPRAIEPELTDTPSSTALDSGPSSADSNLTSEVSSDGVIADTPPNPHQLVLFGCLPLLPLLLPISGLWRTALVIVFAVVAFSLALLVKIVPSTLEDRLEEIQGEGARAQKELVDGLRELVAEAEGLDRTVNAVLRRVADADKASYSPQSPSDLSPLPLLPLRQTLLSHLTSLSFLANTTATALLPYTSPFELSILSSMYGLVSTSPSHPPPSPVTPSGLRPFASSPHATKRMSVPVRSNPNRFVSPPRSRETSASSTISSGESGEPRYSPGKFTALPPRTPRSTKRQTWTPNSASRGHTRGGEAFSPPSSAPNFSSLLPSLLPSDEEDLLTPVRRMPSLDLTLASPSPGIRITKRLSHQGLLYAAHPSSPSVRKPPPPSPIRSPLSPIGHYNTTPSQTRTRRTTLPSQPRPIIVESEESEDWEDSTVPVPYASKSSPLSRTTSHPLPRPRPSSSLYSPSPFLLSEADEDEVDEGDDDPCPMSHGHLLSSFLTLHIRRRHTLVSLLALRKESSPNHWEDLSHLVHTFSTAFADARAELARAVALSKLGGGGDVGWAPSGKARREEWVSRLEAELEQLSTRLREGSRRGEEEDRWEDWWEGLRGDLGGLVRVWERARDEMGTHRNAVLGSNRAPPVRPTTATEFDSLLDDEDPPPSDLSQGGEDADREDDVTLHLLTQSALPPIGREELFAGETAPAVIARPASSLSRAERIALAKSSRAEKVESGPRVVGLGDVVSELKGLMGELRRRKGPIGSSFDETAEEDEEDHDRRTPPQRSEPRFASPSPPGSDSITSTSSSPSPRDASGQPRAFGFPGMMRLPPPPNRTSLPALSCGSSDGDEGSAEGDLVDHFDEDDGDGDRAEKLVPEGLGCGGSESTLGGVGVGGI